MEHARPFALIACPAELIPPEPPVANPYWQNGAERARARRLRRGEANPCVRAPFCDADAIDGRLGGMSGSSCWWALSVPA
jgi:hypothetical protein